MFVLFLKVFHYAQTQDISLLLIEPTGQVGHRQLATQLHPQAVHPEHTNVSVVVLYITQSTSLHICAMYLLFTIAARMPLQQLSYELSFIPTSAKQIPTSASD